MTGAARGGWPWFQRHSFARIQADTLKDLKLVREVAHDSSVQLPLLNAVLERVGDVEKSHADDDLAAVYELKLPGT